MPSQNDFQAKHWVVASGLLLAWFASGCAETADVQYLSAIEIQQSIIGRNWRREGSGYRKERFYPVDEEMLHGRIRGQRRFAGLYQGSWSIVGEELCVAYPQLSHADGCLRLARGEGGKVLWFDDSGKLDSESRSGFGSELAEQGAAEVPASKILGPRVRQEQVTFLHGGNSLVADLRLPVGPAPYPAVVFVHGSGPASRRSYYLEIIGAEFLSRGFATFVWSKPGVDESTGDYLQQSMSLRAEEVAAAISKLGERAEIDDTRIGLWGMSEAGWVMPLVPAHEDVAFVISVSGSGQSAQEQHLHLVDKELARLGMSHADRKDALEHRVEFYHLMRQSRDYQEFVPRHDAWLAEMKLRPWYEAVESELAELAGQRLALSPGPREFEFFSVNLADDADRTLIPAPQLKNFSMPVLAIYGSRDAVVDAKLGSKAYRKLSPGNPAVTVKLFQGADHGIMKRDRDGYRDLAPHFLSLMGDWLAERR